MTAPRWGPDRHIVIYYVKPDRSEIYLVTSQPEPEFRIESWSAKGDVKELRKAYADFHPQVRRVLAACPACTNGRWSTAIRCRTGATATSRCSAMPAIR